MARKPLGQYKAGGVVLTCNGCGKQDAFEVRNAHLLAGFFRQPMRNLKQIICWNCGAVHWFSRDVPGVDQ